MVGTPQLPQPQLPQPQSASALGGNAGLTATQSTGKSSSMQTAIATGMDRYITITSKRKRSPQGERNAPKHNTKKKQVNSAQNLQTSNNPLNNNRYAPLTNLNENQTSTSTQASKEPKPPPIYVRERSSSTLIAYLTRLVGDNFHVVALTRGNLHETKVQVNTEDSYRTVVKDLEANNKNFYTYQLKSSKGITVVIKGIDSDVDPNEIKEALGEQGFHAKAVTNIFNKKKEPQPIFRVELLPDSTKLKKNEDHPIYKIQYLLHRRITIEPPHPRNGPVQCANCQEFNHTKKYCTLRPVCVACGELHRTSDCTKKSLNDRSLIKCGNCGGNHTASYRGCEVYKHLKRNFSLKRQVLRNPNNNPFIAADFAPHQPASNPLTPGYSYAEALKSNASNHPPYPAPGNNLEIILTQFMQSMQNMVNQIIQMQSQLMSALLPKK